MFETKDLTNSFLFLFHLQVSRLRHFCRSEMYPGCHTLKSFGLRAKTVALLVQQPCEQHHDYGFGKSELSVIVGVSI